MKIIVAIPCYNCEKQIPRVLHRFSPELLSRIDRVLVIDNQSTDNTLHAAQQTIASLDISDKVWVLRNRANYGLGGSHKVALLSAESMGADYLGIVHGDDQGRAEELASFIDQAIAHPEAAAILGARFMPSSRLEGYSRLRTAGNRALNIAYTLLGGRRTYDLGAGLNLFRLRDLKNHEYLGFSDAFTFNMDLLLHYFKSKALTIYQPLTWTETDQISNARAWRVGWITLRTLLEWRFGRSRRLKRQANDYLSDRASD